MHFAAPLNLSVMCFFLLTMNRLVTIVISVLVFPLLTGAQHTKCKLPIEYGSRNQVDPKRSDVSGLSGRVISEAGHAAKEVGPVPACLGLFTEKDHRLVASAVADEEGHFRFKSIASGRYHVRRTGVDY
jgi:hypothetical protein